VASVHLSLSTAPPIHEALVIGRRGHFRLVEHPAGPPFENAYRLELNGTVVREGLQAPSLYARQLEEFVDAVQARRRPLASGAEIVDVMRVLDAARASLRSGQPVALAR
jgi:predicted dehydrogenase